MPATAAETPPSRGAGASVRFARTAADAAAPPAAAGRATPAQPRGDGVPSINDLPPQSTAGLPRLSIDLHVYAGDAAQRFVVVNGRRYREGERLQEGPTLVRVTPDGAILDHNGLRFLLPRQ
jgi:general secretion pathway protein B